MLCLFPHAVRTDNRRRQALNSSIRSLHHLTATVNGAQEDLDFYVGILGQRLVKKTVNFDNHHVYHFYYGDERGTPGTIMTTFPYGGTGLGSGVRGVGQVSVTSFSIPASSLDFWRLRFEEHDIAFERRHGHLGVPMLRFSDPSGLVLQLVATDSDTRQPWRGAEGAGIHGDVALRGLFGVTLLVRDPSRTIGVLEELLNGRVIDAQGNATRVGVGGSAPGHIVDIVRAQGEPGAVNGLGTVHHVAFAVDTEEEQLLLREELMRCEFSVTEVLDREYFRSIYFREPNGVLFEIATVSPGFTVDEDVAQLGQSLKLPPWEDANRADIEAHLPRVVHP